GDVDTVLTRHGGDFRRRPDQDGGDDSGLGRLDGATQRRLVAGMRDDGRDRRHLLGAADQSVVFCMGLYRRCRFRNGHRVNSLFPRRLAMRLQDAFATLILLSALLGVAAAPASAPNNPAICCKRSAASPLTSPRALTTSRSAAKALRRCAASGGSSDGMAASA